jgi:lactate racemase
MRIEVAFGKDGLTLQLPDRFHYEILEARSAAPLGDAAGALSAGLDAPIGSLPLDQMARGKRTVAISVCDITRPAPNQATLPHVLARLERAGIQRENITFLIATGLHRPATDGEIREILGPEIADRYRVVNHNARALGEHRYLGTTTSGTPVYIDERFVAADLHITLGFIEPHLMLGFSGGRKLIAPGLAAQETIKVLHSPRFMRDRRAVEGSVESNPLHRELLEIAALAGHHFALDVALTRRREIAGVFAGDPVTAHRAGMDFVARVMLEELPEAADAVITTAAGYPLDLTFYQAVKGITAASHIARPGGRILLAAACQEGAGAAEFCDMLKKTVRGEDFLRLIAEAPVVVDQWQLEKLALVTQKADLVYYVPGLSAEYHPWLWGEAAASPERAVEALVEGLADGARIAILPEGPYVLARARGAELTAR